MHFFLPHYSLCIHLISLLLLRGAWGATFTVTSKCEDTVWPGILDNAGTSELSTTGFELQPGESGSFQVPPSWSRGLWGRTDCAFDPNSGQGSCVTGDCGSNQVECNGAGATPPATLVEFTTASDSQDYYDVSLVDGYNLPMQVDAAGGSGSCASTGCVADLNRQCPNELRVGEHAACKSACEAFRIPEYCCSGAYASPGTCKLSVYLQIFKSACPKSYSYAYDDSTSTFTCSGADYTMTFCPAAASQKSARDSAPENGIGEAPIGIDSAWLPDFVISHSPKSVSCSSPSIATLIVVLIFQTMQFFR